MPKRVMMAVGGTGGHIYPACALAEQITSKDDCIDILFAGGHLKNNPYFNKLQWPFENISCGHFNSKNPMKLGSSLSLNLQGVYESIKIIKKFNPSLIIGFGSYHSLPTLLAAKL
jgi:UDP-N-acetylglucosamine--N-acetylmuramyl-(pentapeptide) pyrophosphoryl-undecaprenol N-acetylglucosamine transferase